MCPVCISVIFAWPSSVSLRILHADNSFNVFELIFNVIFFFGIFFFSEIAIVGVFWPNETTSYTQAVIVH